MDKIINIILIIILTTVSCVGDSRGFYYASKVWNKNGLDFSMIARSIIGFSIGIGVYFILIKYLQKAGVFSAEIQTAIWIVGTIVLVALVSREFFKWQRIEQMISVLLIFGIVWLLLRVSS